MKSLVGRQFSQTEHISTAELYATTRNRNQNFRFSRNVSILQPPTYAYVSNRSLNFFNGIPLHPPLPHVKSPGITWYLLRNLITILSYRITHTQARGFSLSSWQQQFLFFYHYFYATTFSVKNEKNIFIIIIIIIPFSFFRPSVCSFVRSFVHCSPPVRL